MRIFTAVFVAVLFLPAAALADYTATRTGTQATLNGNADGDALIITVSGGLLRHNRFDAGDVGFQSNFDWDTTAVGDQTLATTAASITVNAGDGLDQLQLDDAGAAAGLSYVITSTAIQRTGLTITYNQGSVLEDVRVTTSPGVNTVQLQSSSSNTPDATPLTVNLGDGDDQIDLGLSQSLSQLRGRTRVIGGAGTDHVRFLDSSGLFENGSVLLGNATVIRGNGHAQTAYEGFEELTYFGSNLVSEIFEVSSTACKTTIHGGNGNNVLRPADAVTLQGGSYHGGSHTDTIDYAAWTTAVTANIGTRHMFMAVLDGESQVPEADSPAFGFAFLSYAPDTQRFDLTAEVFGIQPSRIQASHLHAGAAGTNGPVIVELGDRSFWVSINLSLARDTGGAFPADRAADLLAGNVYFNLHTLDFPDGEVRGQFESLAPPLTATGILSLTSVEAVTGGADDDVLIGNDAANTLLGGEGDNVIAGLGGNDSLTAGSGFDLLLGGGGLDVILAGDGDDSIIATDLELGVASAGESLNRIDGGGGDDFVRLTLGASNETVTLRRTTGYALDIVYPAGESRPPVTEHMLNVEAIFVSGQNGDDSMVSQNMGPSGSVILIAFFGGGGADTLDASAIGIDLDFGVLLDGGSGNDILTGGITFDFLNGDNGNDVLTGGPGIDGVFGGLDNDLIIWNPGDGDDFSFGEAGHDELRVSGGAGTDVFDMFWDNDEDVGFLVVLDGDIFFDEFELITLRGNGGDDRFNIPVMPNGPTTTVATIAIDGGTSDSGSPDILNYNAGCGVTTHTPGRIDTASRWPITYTGIESVSITGNVSFTPMSASFGPSGGTASVNVTSSGCAWTATSGATWIDLIGTTSGSANAVVQYRVRPNLLVSSRSGAVLIGGAPVTVTQTGAPTAPMSPGDFTSDGTLDLLFQHQTAGDLGVWSMNGTARIDAFALTPNRVPTLAWQIVGSGDFNSDGKPDLVWQHLTSGALAVWFMNGTVRTDVQFLTPMGFSDPAWRVRAVGDFNRDGHPDLVIQHTTMRSVGVWYMNGITLVDGRLFSPPSTESAWEIVGAPDLNGDGFPDLVFQHTDGFLAAWFMQNATQLDAQFLSPNRAPSGWRVRAIGDINADGHPDLILQHTSTGELAAWLMNGITLIDGVLLSPPAVPSPLWKLVGPR